eukprot:COSAG05_NODE_20587_length_278_cov_0.687151_1_plen_30_part_10
MLRLRGYASAAVVLAETAVSNSASVADSSA